MVLEEELAPCPNVCEKTGAKALLEQVPCPFTIEEVYRQQSKSTTRYVYFWGVMDIGYKMLHSISRIHQALYWLHIVQEIFRLRPIEL